MIKVTSCHHLMPLPLKVFTTEGLGPGQAINHILRRPHLPDISSLDFGKFDEGQTVDESKTMKYNVDMYGRIIHLYFPVTY